MSMEEIYADAIKDPSIQPKKLLRKAYDGTIIAMSYAEILLNRAIKDFGTEQLVGYPDTAYHLPVITCLSGEKVTKLGELVPILNRMRNQVRTELNFDNARLWGESTLYAAEVIETINYLRGEEPKTKPWTGFLGDPIVRKHGIKMVDWTIPGVAVILGRAKDSPSAKKIVDNLMGKGFMIFLCDEIIEQLLEENVKIGEDYIAFPIGNFTQIIHAVNYAFRAGLAFGGIPAGERENHRDYQRRRVRAFVLQFGERDDVKIAASMGAIFMGFPTVTDQPLSEDDQIPDWYISEPDYEKIVALAMEVRGIKLTNIEIPIPVNFGPAFEGESIRKGDMYVEMGGGRTTAYELVHMVGPDEIVDGQVTVIGPELDSIPEGSKLPLGININVYGRKMQSDFEGVLERRIHYFANYGEGVWHVAQRDLCWVRVSKDARAKGFLMKHFGELLLAKLKQEFPAIIDRVEVIISTDQATVEAGLIKARARYQTRDDRMKSLTDESVEDFYSCLLCQSFAPNHVCVVSPERVGLCGAVSWLDAKASYEISPNGPNQPIPKGASIDELKGMWQSTNDFVYKASNNTIEEVNLYTLMDKPMTSCGCFEAIMAIVPEVNGLMLTTREHSGMTPCGMTFSGLAGTCGGGLQTPGFMGIGRTYLLSKKFIPADGGIARIVWMPKELKDFLRGQDFAQRAIDEGLGADFLDKIADESVGTTSEEITSFLEENGHPCFALDPLM